MPKQFPSLTDLWLDYASLCVPSDAGKIQQIETKQAFIAGVISMFEVVKCLTQLPEEYSTAVLETYSMDIEKIIQETGQKSA